MSGEKNLSSEAKMIRELLKKQPQNKNAGIDESTFYRKIPLLIKAKIIKKTNDGFAMSTYVEVQKEIEDYLDECIRTGTLPITLNEIASTIGVSICEIKKVIYPIVMKRGLLVRVKKGEEEINEKAKGVLI